MPVTHSTRFQQLIKRMLSVKDNLRLTLADDVLPVFPLVDPAAADLERWREEKSWEGGGTASAIAAQYAFLELDNPSNSNALIIVKRIWHNFTGGAIGLPAYLTKSTGNGTSLGGVMGYRDGRNFPTGASVKALGDLRQGNSATVPPVNGQFLTIFPATYYDLNWAPHRFLILPPGFSVQLWHTTVNTGLTAGFQWTERTVEPDELA